MTIWTILAILSFLIFFSVVFTNADTSLKVKIALVSFIIGLVTLAISTIEAIIALSELQ